MNWPRSHQISDELLIKGILAGDASSYHLFQRKYGGKLFRIIYNFMGNRADAEEVLNDVLYAIISAIDTYDRTKASFKTWIYHIAINSSIDFLRTQKKPLKRNGSTYVETLAPKHMNNTETLTPQIVILRNILGRMKDRDRVLLEMHYAMKLTHNEIAGYLKLSPGTVRTALHRARIRLKQELIRYPEFRSYIAA